MTRNQIKFAHHYKKLGIPPPTRVRLLTEKVIDAKDIPKWFVKHDTVYTVNGEEHHVEMPEGIVLMLWFCGDSGRFFPTIRSVHKEEFYHRAIGEWFDVIIKGE